MFQHNAFINSDFNWAPPTSNISEFLDSTASVAVSAAAPTRLSIVTPATSASARYAAEMAAMSSMITPTTASAAEPPVFSWDSATGMPAYGGAQQDDDANILAGDFALDQLESSDDENNCYFGGDVAMPSSPEFCLPSTPSGGASSAFPSVFAPMIQPPQLPQLPPVPQHHQHQQAPAAVPPTAAASAAMGQQLPPNVSPAAMYYALQFMLQQQQQQMSGTGSPTMIAPSPASSPVMPEPSAPTTVKRELAYNYNQSAMSPATAYYPPAASANRLPEMFLVEPTEKDLQRVPYHPPAAASASVHPAMLEEIRRSLQPHALMFVVLESTQRGSWLPGFPDVLGPDNAKLRYRFVFKVPHARYVDWNADFELFSHNGPEFLEVLPNGQLSYPDLQFVKTDLLVSVDMQSVHDSSLDYVVVEMHYQIKCKKDGPKKRASAHGLKRKLVYAPKFHFKLSMWSDALQHQFHLNTPQFVHGSRKANGVYDRRPPDAPRPASWTERLDDETSVYQMLQSGNPGASGYVYTTVPAQPDSNLFFAIQVGSA